MMLYNNVGHISKASEDIDIEKSPFSTIHCRLTSPLQRTLSNIRINLNMLVLASILASMSFFALC